MVRTTVWSTVAFNQALTLLQARGQFEKKKLNCYCFNLSHFFRDDDEADDDEDDEESMEEESPVKASRCLYRGVLN